MGLINLNKATGFRPFGVVEQAQTDWPLPDFLAAPPPFSRWFFTDYFAAGSTASPNSSPSMPPDAVRSTMGTRFLDRYTSPTVHGFQQPAADKVPSSELSIQQDCSLTQASGLAARLNHCAAPAALTTGSLKQSLWDSNLFNRANQVLPLSLFSDTAGGRSLAFGAGARYDLAGQSRPSSVARVPGIYFDSQSQSPGGG